MSRTLQRALRQAGELVREKRSRADMSQRELAERLTLTQSTVSHVERGKGSPSAALECLRALGNVPRAIRSELERA